MKCSVITSSVLAVVVVSSVPLLTLNCVFVPRPHLANAKYTIRHVKVLPSTIPISKDPIIDPTNAPITVSLPSNEVSLHCEREGGMTHNTTSRTT